MPDEYYVGEPLTLYEPLPDYRERVNSLVFTGNTGGADLYSFYNFTGYQYCFDLVATDGRVGMFMFNFAGGHYGDYWLKSFRHIDGPCYSSA